MISSIFGKTKPINYIIVVTFLFFFYWLVQYKLFDLILSTEEVILKLVVLVVLLFSIFVIDFIVKRNKLTGANSFSVLFYGLLIVCFWETLSGKNVILCSFFLLLGTRRLLSVKSLKSTKNKIFDATLWILIASLFFDWAIVYVLLVFTTIYIYEPKNIRNWMVPFSAVFCFSIVLYIVLFLANQISFLETHYQFKTTSFSTIFSSWGNSSKLAVYIILNGLLGFWSFLTLGKSGVGKITTVRLLILSFILGITLHVLSSNDNEFPLMVSFFASSVLISNYVDAIEKPNIKEIALMIAVFIPFLVFVTSLILQ